MCGWVIGSVGGGGQWLGGWVWVLGVGCFGCWVFCGGGWRGAMSGGGSAKVSGLVGAEVTKGEVQDNGDDGDPRGVLHPVRHQRTVINE